MSATDMRSIESREKELNERIEAEIATRYRDFCANYIERILASSPDDAIRQLTVDLVSDKHVLSKVHTKYTKVVSEIERLDETVPLAVFGLKAGIIDCRTRHIRASLKQACATPNPNPEVIQQLMTENVTLDNLKKELAHYLGERIIVPRR